MTNWVAIAKCLFQGQPKSLELRERSWGNEVAAHLVAGETSLIENTLRQRYDKVGLPYRSH
jgi:hypothetical protein